MSNQIKKLNQLTKKENLEHELHENNRDLGKRILIITAPPGAGKTSCIYGLLMMNYFLNQVLEKTGLPPHRIIYMPGVTTRPLRKNEFHHFDFHFLSHDQYFKQLANKDFLFYFTSDPHLYAIDGKHLDMHLHNSDERTVFIYNLNAFQVEKFRNKFTEKPHVVFLMAPSWEELEKRKFKRGGLSPEEIEFRKETMRKEAEQGEKVSDIKVVNSDFTQTIHELTRFVVNNVFHKNKSIPKKYLKKIDNGLKNVIRENKDYLMDILKK